MDGGGGDGSRAAMVMRDCQATYNNPAVKAAVARLGGHCIVDFVRVPLRIIHSPPASFTHLAPIDAISRALHSRPQAWLGPGEVIVIELNPFDGVCLGTFPASTGLFLWDHAPDQAIMKGEAPFEMRLRTRPLESERLWAQCNADWRNIVHPLRYVASGVGGADRGGSRGALPATTADSPPSGAAAAGSPVEPPDVNPV